MSEVSYLQWLVNETPTSWWHDSGDPAELSFALSHGATGVTTNPVLLRTTLNNSSDLWQEAMNESEKGDADSLPQDELRMRTVIQYAAGQLQPRYEQTQGRQGYVCAQVNPALAGNRDAMMDMARRFNGWAPNIAVKLPATAAGLDVLEECVAEGMTVASTVSFTVAQVLAAAERHCLGLERAKQAGHPTGRCFVVIMIGRIDDYLSEVACDSKANIADDDLRQAGIAISRRAYMLLRENDYEAVLLIAALRGAYHMLALAGADIVMSIHPRYQAMLLKPGVPRDPNRIDIPVTADVIERLASLPEFVKAYEPNGMSDRDFITYGVAQKTLSQFYAAGWAML